MALTGLQIQKLLPGTNCKECGSNTCLAFAMKLAAKKADLSECPYASDEAKRVLGEATEPPVRAVALGEKGDIVTGEETVLYRHEKTFVHPTLIAVTIRDTDDDAAVAAAIENIKSYRFERVGETFGIDMAALLQKGNDGARFIALAEKIAKETGKPLVLRSSNVSALKEASKKIKGSRSVLCAPAAASAEELLAAAKDDGHALALTGSMLDELFSIAQKIRDGGFLNVLLHFTTHSLAEQFQVNAIARTAAIKGGVKPLGFPFLRFIDSGNGLDDTVEAVTEIAKYGGIVALPGFDAAQIAALMTLRLNIFTDPQKPIQVEPNIYPIGEPTTESPVFVTTNFSLTYFVVSGEIENSGKSAWLVVPECEGMSVLTAWAAGKFNAEKIAAFMKERNADTMVTRKRLVIPGYVAQLSGELEESLPGWEILVGPQEAADIESFVKSRL
ncbi:MAG: acetyl-CoA decarbonylase/synthase complex subunit gamma [Spirochaetes bacterium]|nr:acetyl-CoA decarbonylase/synthase complex subunit gamma [Spirochaetota bacterium]